MLCYSHHRGSEGKSRWAVLLTHGGPGLCFRNGDSSGEGKKRYFTLSPPTQRPGLVSMRTPGRQQAGFPALPLSLLAW